MANRMDIELTSARDDETFTWRAAGARQPKGVVPVSVLPPHPKVGDVLRAEVEIELDGITVLSVTPVKQKIEDASKRIEYIGPPRPAAGVTTVLAGRSDRRAAFGRDGDRPGRRPAGERGDRGDRGQRREGEARPNQSGARRDGPRRPEGADRTRGEPRAPRDGGGPDGRPSPGRPPRSSHGPGTGERDGSSGRGTGRRMPPRFEPGTAHRDQLFETLTPEQKPIAERLAVGGLPAVRKALTEEQQRARSEGRPAASGESIIALAEQLLGDVKAAVWLDRAEAAVAKADEITLRDLRATVIGAAPRDESGRELERQLRDALEKRVAKLRHDWEQHLTQALDDGRVLQAMRLSAKPPEPTARFPAALVMRLAEASGQAMTADTAPDRWLSLLEAAVQAPVRRQIRPAGLPKDPSGEVERQARAAASRIPALGRLLGMAIPPPPQPVAGGRPARPGPRPATSHTVAEARPAVPPEAGPPETGPAAPPEAGPAGPPEAGPAGPPEAGPAAEAPEAPSGDAVLSEELSEPGDQL